MDLLKTKLIPPIEPGRLIVRSRLQGYIERLSHTKLTLVQTPAGYGKTSLLWQWHQSLCENGEFVGWVSFDTTDNDPVSMMSYVASALKGHSDALAQVAFQFNSERYLQPELMMSMLTNALISSPHPVYLFLDDAHLAGDDVLKTLERLIEVTPPTLRFIISSRVAPLFSLAKMRVAGDLLEVTVEDLLFRADETKQYLAEQGHSGLVEEELKTLESRTEGWITGIKLVSLGWRPDVNAQEFFASFSGTRSSVADFFAEEVLAAQKPEIQHFLLMTSVLDRFTPDLCNTIINATNAREIIDEIEASGLFLLKLDEDRTWYRYHHLFSEFLQRNLSTRDPQAKQKICADASQWFYQNGDNIKAIAYALQAESYQRAAEILDLCSQDLAQTGRIRIVTNFAQQIPMEVLKHFPHVLLTWSWLCIYNLHFEKTETLLGIVRQYLREVKQDQDSDSLRHLNALLLHREMSLAAAQDDANLVEQLAEQLIREHAEDINLYLLSTAYSILAYAQRVQYRLQNVESLLAQAKGASKRSGYPLSQLVYYANAGPYLLAAGKLHTAEQTLSKGLAKAIHLEGPRSALAAMVALPLAEVVYERNDLKRARKLITDTLPAVTIFGFVDQFISGYVTQSRLLAAEDNIQAAHQVLDEGMAVALDRSLGRLQMKLSAERIRLFLNQGNLDQANRYARAAGIPTSAERITPSGHTHTTFEAQATAWVRIAQKQGRLNEAIHVAKQWRRFSNARNAIHSLILWDILLAESFLLQGDARAAQRSLREALVYAAPRRIIRSFLDEGTIMQTLLEQAVSEQSPSEHPIDEFTEELLQTYLPDTVAAPVKVKRSTPEGLYGKLTAKELEILSLVAAGMRNSEVAGKLGMTEGSVKWYLQQIYDKVGTRRRLQAVERARQLGLIA